MPNHIESKALEFVDKVFKNSCKKSDRKTFDRNIDGKYAEVKGKGATFSKIDFISITTKQFIAAQKGSYFIYLVTGINENKSELRKISTKDLMKVRPRIIVSYEYDRSKIEKIAKKI